jgi:hypothetical protein
MWPVVPCRTFDVSVWYATVPHRQVFEGEWVRKVFKSRDDSHTSRLLQ